jgi:creatinine amidohydrolase
MKFHEATAPQIAALDRESALVVAPLAAVEQHGPHMPTGTDHILCTAMAEAIEARFPDRILLAPTMWLGASAHHLRFGSTLDTSLDAYIEVLLDLGRSLLDDGFRRLLFLNGHGGNIDPMRVAVRRLQPGRENCLVAAACYWSVASEEIADTLEGAHKFVGHACEFETSMMLHVRPDLVDRERCTDAGELIDDTVDGVFLGRDMRHRTREGYTGRPDLASPGKGSQLFDAITERWTEVVPKLLESPLGTTWEDFRGMD